MKTFRSKGVANEIGSSNWGAIQYGSLLVVAPWLDITKKAKVKGCFGIITVEGNLQEVPDDLGLVRCEREEHSERLGAVSSCEDEWNRTQPETAAKHPDNNTLDAAFQLDTLTVDIYTAVFSTGGCLYRLKTTVRSDGNVRIVDPSRVIMGLAHSHSIQCKHDPASAMNSGRTVKYVDDFDRMLATWPCFNTRTDDTIQSSKVLDSELKINVVLSLLTDGSVRRETSTCCFDCAIAKLQGLEDLSPRCIINTTAYSSALVPTGARKGRTEF